MRFLIPFTLLLNFVVVIPTRAGEFDCTGLIFDGKSIITPAGKYIPDEVVRSGNITILRWIKNGEWYNRDEDLEMAYERYHKLYHSPRSYNPCRYAVSTDKMSYTSAGTYNRTLLHIKVFAIIIEKLGPVKPINPDCEGISRGGEDAGRIAERHGIGWTTPNGRWIPSSMEIERLNNWERRYRPPRGQRYYFKQCRGL